MSCVDVPSGRIALEIIRNSVPFDLAIIDMHMPDMTGDELAQQIRAAHEAVHLPVLLLTSMSARPSSNELFDAFLVKPVRAGLLRSTVGELLRPDRGRSSSTFTSSPRTASDPGAVVLDVLLGEDNVVNQRVGQLMLTRLGHHVDVVDTGQEALEAVSRKTYDVVLMDVHMPIMDGLEAARSIRAKPSSALPSQPRIIALTASSLDSDRKDCLNAGMDGYLLKPITVESLAAALDRSPPNEPPAHLELRQGHESD